MLGDGCLKSNAYLFADADGGGSTFVRKIPGQLSKTPVLFTSLQWERTLRIQFPGAKGHLISGLSEC